MSWVTSFCTTENLARALSWRSRRNRYPAIGARSARRTILLRASDAAVDRPAVRQPGRAGRALQGHAARRRGAHEGTWVMAEGPGSTQGGRGVPRVHEGAAEAAEARLVMPLPSARLAR